MIQLLQRSDATSCIDAKLVRLANRERDYWRAVLERVAETIRFHFERGLLFRDSDEVIGSSRNGKYLSILELLAKRRIQPFDGKSSARSYYYGTEIN